MSRTIHYRGRTDIDNVEDAKSIIDAANNWHDGDTQYILSLDWNVTDSTYSVELEIIDVDSSNIEETLSELDNGLESIPGEWVPASEQAIVQ